MDAVWDPDNVVIICGTGGEVLAEEISGIIGLPSTCCMQYRAADGESHVRVQANVRGRDVFVIQSTSAPVNTNLVELGLILSTCRRASARRVTAVAPYLGYGRQTRKDKSRVPISAADVATLLEECSIDGLVTVDAHDPMIAGFYSPLCAFENLSYVSVAARFLFRKGFRSSVVVAPGTSNVPYAMTLVETLRELDSRKAAARIPASMPSSSDAAAAPASASPVTAASDDANGTALAGLGSGGGGSGGGGGVAPREIVPVSLSSASLSEVSGAASMGNSASIDASIAASSVASPLMLRTGYGANDGGLDITPGRAPAGVPTEGFPRGGLIGKQTAALAMLLPVERRGAKGSLDRGVKELELTGDVAGRDCILVDDMIDTGMTLTKASRELIARGASCVVAFATHALLSQDSADRLARCEELSFIIISNSVPIMATLPKDHALRRKLAVLSVAPMIAHHICKLSGLPLPDMDPQEPTHALHVSSNLTEEQPHSAAYLMKKAEREEFKSSQDGSQAGDSFFDDDGHSNRRGGGRDEDSETTESEYSAY